MHGASFVPLPGTSVNRGGSSRIHDALAQEVESPAISPSRKFIYTQSMGDSSFDIDLNAVRAFLATKEERRRVALDLRFERARTDFDAIVERIVARHSPRRVYQWGSLLDRCEGIKHIYNLALTLSKIGVTWGQLIFKSICPILRRV
jgi:hypothetical protein